MKFEGIKLKVDPPSKFSGTTKDNYEDFEKRLRTYLCLSDTRFPKLLKWTLNQGMPITNTMLMNYAREHTLSEEELKSLQFQMNPFLYYTLMSLIERSACTILEQVKDENALEACRKLYRR